MLALAGAALAQEPVRVSTRLIETDLVVRDSHGPVGDLTVDAFKILEDGKERAIAVFQVSSPVGAADLKTAALPPGVFSNRSGGGVRRGHSRVLLIDTLNTQFEDQMFARDQLLKMLDGIPLHDPIAIYVLGEDFRVLQDFTTDLAKLKAAMQAFQPVRGVKMLMSNTPDFHCLDCATVDNQRARNHSVYDRADQTLDVFDQLAHYLERIPGRKSVIWISNTFPASYLRIREDPLSALKAADVAIYPVHARGLEFSALTNPRDYEGELKSGRASTSLNAELSTATWVADQTGGRAFFDRSDLGEAARQALEDGEVTYTLGFYAQRDKPDGKFHALKVKVDRPGVEVRSRTEYLDKASALSGGDTKTLLRRLADASVEAQDIGLIAAIGRAGTNFKVAVQVDFKDLRLSPENGKWKGSAELDFLCQSADGRTLDLASKTISFNMTDDAYQARRREGFALEQLIPARKDMARIRVIVVDQAGGAGAVSLTVQNSQ